MAARPKRLAPTLGYAALYAVLGALSFATASVATNTAAVWIPTGFSLALLIAKGRQLWPAVALGSFVLNLGDNILFAGPIPLVVEMAVALVIAVGNTGEALLGWHLSRRFAGGAELLARPAHVAVFAALVATMPPLLSAGIGVVASYAGGLVPAAALPEVMLTWYLANSVGVLIVTAPLIVLFARRNGSRRRVPPVEAACLLAGLLFASQATSGVYVLPVLSDWPRAYMIIPLLLWAAFRFRTSGVLIAIVLVAAVSVAGSMRGFEAFPAQTHSRSLLYLQLFLGFLSVTTLAITAALTEIDALQTGLTEVLRDRTSEVERLVRARNLFSSLVVHDLQSPLYGVRNTLRAAAGALERDTLSTLDTIASMKVMDETCTALAVRMAVLLDEGDAIIQHTEAELLRTVVQRIAKAKGLNAPGRVVLQLGEADLSVRRPVEVERILEGLVGNALEHGPPDAPIDICAYRHGSQLEILVVDGGAGVGRAQVPMLFRPEMRAVRRDTTGLGGQGLFLASEQAVDLGGRLTYVAGVARSTFRLILPS